MALQHLLTCAVFEVEDADGLVIAAAGHGLAVGAEADRCHRRAAISCLSVTYATVSYAHAPDRPLVVASARYTSNGLSILPEKYGVFVNLDEAIRCMSLVNTIF